VARMCMEEEEEEAKLVILPGMIIYMIIYTKGSRLSALPTLDVRPNQPEHRLRQRSLSHRKGHSTSTAHCSRKCGNAYVTQLK
jgi:hypothetical protein